jgi:hypothetical protein
MNLPLRPPYSRAEKPSAPPNSSQPRLIGRDIRDLRKARGRTLAALAETSGLSIGYLSLLEDAVDPSAVCGVARAQGHDLPVFRR